jgi:hypothetical protein
VRGFLTWQCTASRGLLGGLRGHARRGLLMRMGARTYQLGFAGLLFGLGVVLAVPHGLRADAMSGKAAGCVDFHGDARYLGFGYNHIVTLKSSCKVAMTCSVKTDVNPEPTSVDIAPGEETSVTTWQGSPARVFTPNVTCAAKRGSP